VLLTKITTFLTTFANALKDFSELETSATDVSLAQLIRPQPDHAFRFAETTRFTTHQQESANAELAST
jgi:hypothetical protein